MSNSIWHKQDEKPKDFCEVVLSDFRTGSYCVFLSPFHDLSFNYDRWCYFDELLAQADKAERLQKAVDLALDELDTIGLEQHKTTPPIILIKYAQRAKDEIKQLIKETTNDK